MAANVDLQTESKFCIEYQYDKVPAKGREGSPEPDIEMGAHVIVFSQMLAKIDLIFFVKKHLC